MLAYVLAVVVILVAALLAFGLAALLHLQGAAYLVFVILLLLLGIAAAVVILVMHYKAKKEKEQQGEPAGAAASSELDLLLNDANRKLRASQQGAKTLEAMPLIYILGDAGSAKTTTVMKSGLDPELLAGTAPHEGDQVPTDVINLWFTRAAALLEVGASVRLSNALLSRLVHRTRATAYRSAFGTGAAPRAAIVCVSMDQVQAADGGQSLMASARATGAQLREISRLLGMPVPVYIILTKLDRVPHFDKYVRNLSEAEVRQILGTALPRTEASAGTYVDQATHLLSGVIDGLIYKLGEFRVEMLDRETDAASAPGVYEFPREFGKLRKNLNQYLVELCKPSQLSANPYLRGFYFTGVRARMVEHMAAAPAPVERAAPQEAGATQYLNISASRARMTAAAAPVMVSSRVPQWSFLARLLPEVILADKSALSATRQSAPARLFRRILFGTLAFLFALYIIFLVVSYINNAALERRIQADAQALPVVGATAVSMPSLTDLKTLDDLRQTILQLDNYRANGAPLSYRFGLYQGDKLAVEARRIYFDRFRPTMLNPAQANFVAYMRSLPDVPLASSDSGSYNSAYNALKAYLITTNHPEKSQVSFLTPVFFQYWANTRPVDDQKDLAQKQIDFYGNELLATPPYGVLQPDTALVGHTQVYLSKFLADTRIYQNMLNDADKAGAAVNFNRQYPDAVKLVSDAYTVRGAFTKDGFAFMQGTALQHPEKYAAGEPWVLGNQVGPSFNPGAIAQGLATRYSTDFRNEWHTYLTSARVASCGGPKDAPKALAALSGPASPILELFYLVSHNTAVNDQQIKSVYQPTQALVDPNATDRLIGPGNQAYITALGQLGGALDLATQGPNLDAAAFAPVSQQVVQTEGAVNQTSQAFNVDKETHTETIVIGLMKSPIECVKNLAPTPGAGANKQGGKVCSVVSPLLGKFPFGNNANVQASLAEVDSVFAPETGSFWANYNSPDLKTALVLQGAQYVAAAAAPGPVNPRFLSYFNKAARISSTLYPNGAKSASFAFNLKFIPGNGVASATFVVDGQRIPAGANAQAFTWSGASAQKTTLVYDNNEGYSYQGPWSVFQMVRSATKITRTGTGYRLDYPITTAVAGHIISTGKIASFELSGPGAEFLTGDGFSGLSCASPVILK